MQGIIRSVELRKPFGFIRAIGTDDHFFHHDDCIGDTFYAIKADYLKGIEVKVEFESIRNGDKGMRAQNVQVIYE